MNGILCVFAAGDPSDSKMAELNVARGLIVGVGEQGVEEQVHGVSIRISVPDAPQRLIVLTPSGAAELALALAKMAMEMEKEEAYVSYGET